MGGEDGQWTHSTRSALIGRLPRAEGAKFKTAVVKLFDIDSPHMSAELPKETLEFHNIEKVRIRGLNVTYYLEGNDSILNDLSTLKITKEDSMLTLHGEQEDVTLRKE